MDNTNFDITPNPRVLRMLGEIDFEPWQCFAELIDNAIDSLKNAKSEGGQILRPIVEIKLPSKEDFVTGTAKIIVRDNGFGMTEVELNNCVRAGYSGNDPVDKLGLFGMGFNIATARLGIKTEVWTSRPEDSEWKGTAIDFDQLEKKQKFTVPSLKKGKLKPDERGTEVIISKLHKDRIEFLIDGRSKNKLRTQLGKVYGKFMLDDNFSIIVDDEQVRPFRPCVWSENRSVKHQNEEIPAIIKIDRELEPKKFCRRCWLWLPPEEKFCGNCSKEDAVIMRKRSVKGWIGIQRYVDPEAYGIDFIRNGRKILMGDKSIFWWYNSDTMQEELEYPIDMVGREGGRIVGEIEIDHVRVSHQKDAFQKSDPEWQQVIKLIRGESPLRPNIAERYNLPPNESPLAKLFSGYRRGDVGIRCLVPGDENKRNINQDLKEWAKKFYAGDLEYQSDAKWYEAVLAGERAIKEAKRTPDSKQESKTIMSELFEKSPIAIKRESGESLKEHSVKERFLSKEYLVPGLPITPISVDVFRLASGSIIENGKDELASVFFPEMAGRCEYFYDPNHYFFTQSPYAPYEIFTIDLASYMHSLLENFETRKQWPVTRIFAELIKRYYADELIDYATLRGRAQDMLMQFSEAAPGLIAEDTDRAFRLLSEPEFEALNRKVAQELHAGVDKVTELKDNGKFVLYVPFSYTPRLVMEWPQAFCDGKYWSLPYMRISLNTEENTKKLRNQIINRLYSLLMDAVWLVEDAVHEATNEEAKQNMLRAKYSLSLLEIYRVKND